jgi:acetyl-CoA acetyltransferase
LGWFDDPLLSSFIFWPDAELVALLAHEVSHSTLWVISDVACNEAFASVVMRFQQAFDVDPELVNVNGGSIAMGHPLGATGAIIIGTLLDELERQDKEMGLATLCIASGMGAATIIERV